MYSPIKKVIDFWRYRLILVGKLIFRIGKILGQSFRQWGRRMGSIKKFHLRLRLKDFKARLLFFARWKKRCRARIFIGLCLFFGGCFLIFLPIANHWKNFYLSTSSKQGTQVELGDVANRLHFRDEPIEIDKALLSDVEDLLALPVRVVIPDLGVDLGVKEARVVDGYWEVFDDQAGYGEGSACPGEDGNTVIFAHARRGLFLPLKKVKQGMRVYVFTRQKWYSYKVSEIRQVFPDDVEVIGPSDEPILTLYTCSGFADNKRLVVVARRI